MRFSVRTCVFMLLFAGGALGGVAQQQTIELWPDGAPEPTSFARPEYDPTTKTDRMKAGKVTVRYTNVSKPLMAVYLPKSAKGNLTGALVFPGGGYDHLAWNIEGTEVCEWLNTIGVACAALKYRVPEKGRFPDNPADLEDAQQAMRIFRSHAAAWHVNPGRIGIVGFSAGGNLAALLSRQYGYQGEHVPVSNVSARPDFQILLYPGGLTERGTDGALVDTVRPDKNVTTTLIVQAANDPAVHMEGTLSYAAALKEAGVPTEVHIFAEGGHGFGLRPTEHPVSHWPTLAEIWLETNHLLDTTHTQ
jgi:acetyl esterase/lipase